MELLVIDNSPAINSLLPASKVRKINNIQSDIQQTQLIWKWDMMECRMNSMQQIQFEQTWNQIHEIDEE